MIEVIGLVGLLGVSANIHVSNQCAVGTGIVREITAIGQHCIRGDRVHGDIGGELVVCIVIGGADPFLNVVVPAQSLADGLELCVVEGVCAVTQRAPGGSIVEFDSAFVARG